MKKRIVAFILGIREERVKAGCWIVFVVGIFLLLFIIYSAILGHISGLLAFKLALYETIAMVLLGSLYPFYVRAIGAVAGPAGFLFHSGSGERQIRPAVHKARMRREQRDYHGAVKEYRKLLTAFPDRTDFLYEIAEIYRKDLNDDGRAVRVYREIARKPEEGQYAYLVREAKCLIEEIEGPPAEETGPEGQDEGRGGGGQNGQG